MNKNKRSKYLVEKKSYTVASYHNELLKEVRSLLAIMGKINIKELSLYDVVDKI